MLPGFDLTTFARGSGAAVVLIVITAIIFAESGMLLGFFLPGDTILFTAGFLVQQHVLTVNLHLLVLLLFTAAVAGDNIGYTFGRRVGRRIFRKPDSILFHHENLERAEKFYEKYGVFTVIIARFIPMVRTFAPVVAGVGKMRYRTFFLVDLCGAALWVGSIVYLGYYGGAFLQSHGINVELLVLPVIILATLITLASPLLHILKEPKSRDKFLRKLRLKH